VKVTVPAANAPSAANATAMANVVIGFEFSHDNPLL
jgi:hypothetical protein